MKKWKRAAKGLLYIMAIVIFIPQFVHALNWLSFMRITRFSGFYYILQVLLFTSVISVAFSFSHLKTLFRQRDKKLTIKISKLIVAGLLFAYLAIPYLGIFVHNLGPPLPHPFGVLSIVLNPYGASLILFIVQYNLIYAFKRESDDNEIKEKLDEDIEQP